MILEILEKTKLLYLKNEKNHSNNFEKKSKVSNF